MVHQIEVMLILCLLRVIHLLKTSLNPHFTVKNYSNTQILPSDNLHVFKGKMHYLTVLSRLG